MKWCFDYWLPDSFRIAAATADHAQVTQAEYNIRGFFTTLVYDWETNTVRACSPTVFRFFQELLATLFPTLVIEGGVLWLFGFREKRTWIVFLAVNGASQFLLHLFCGTALPVSGDSFRFLLYLELIIWAAEAAVFARLLGERSMGRRIVYALCANAASFLAGCLPMYLLYML